MQQPDRPTSEELYFEAVDLARRLAETLIATSRFDTRHARLSIALDRARARVRQRYTTAYGHLRRPAIDVRPTEERLW